MFPLRDELYLALVKERQAEIEHEVARYRLARAVRAAQASGPRRLAVLLRRVRRRMIQAEQPPSQQASAAKVALEQRPLQRPACDDQERRRSA